MIPNSLLNVLILQAIGGLLADARAMADYAREECSNFRSNFGIPIPLHVSLNPVFCNFFGRM